ncbi:ATP-binding protein [Streptomyces sp. NPDC092296]|uniref:ATP-binding protein n=1 Tax=Streptomyces sp. NPDC092296 TaxID=3366012 RepID=UPI00381FF5DF
MTDQARSATRGSRPGAAQGRSWSLALPHEADSVPLARAVVLQVLHSLGDPVDSFAASLATTELVANALEHTRGDLGVELVLDWEDQGFRIEVCDGEPLELDLEDLLRAAAMAVSTGEPAEDGRGLLIIRSVADRAGIRTTSHGKAVWCLLEPA